MSAAAAESARFLKGEETPEMPRTATALLSLASRRPSRRMRAALAPEAPGLCLRLRSLVGLAVVLGLATGLGELLIHFLRRRFINPSSFGALQLNPHAFWMVPVSDALIFGACGILLAALSAVSRRRTTAVGSVFALLFSRRSFSS